MLRVNGLNSEYIMRLFDPVTTNATMSGSVYASFIANANYVPSAGQGTYFATFNDVIPNPPTDFCDQRLRLSRPCLRDRQYECLAVYHHRQLDLPLRRRQCAGDPAQGGGPSIIYVPLTWSRTWTTSRLEIRHR